VIFENFSCGNCDESIHKGEEEHARLVWVSNRREREMFKSERGEEVWEGTSREEGGTPR
jgi:hypothetical protein